MAYYSDLRQFIAALEEKGKLVRFKRELVKETEIPSLTWLQYRGLPEAVWKSLLFENVVDAKGRRYSNILLGGQAPSREILALGLMCEPDEINQKWCDAVAHPIEPEIVGSGPVHEVVITGDELESSGLERLAAPAEIPGFGGDIRTTNQMVTKDPETGIRNVGTYSGHFVGRRQIALGIGASHHGIIHLRKWRERGKRMPVAIVVGATPNISLAGTTPLPYEVDELAIAGGIAGEPVKLVKCKTVDLEVPATAEIVIEGEVSNEYELEEGAFGDYPGYVYESEGSYKPALEITCITHRQDPIFVATTVGYPPNESSILSGIAKGAALYRHLKYECYIPGLLDIAFLDSGGGPNFCVAQIKKASPWDPWQVLNAIAGYDPTLGKMMIVVDEDIDPRDPDAVNWALCFSMQPHKDVRIITHRVPLLDPSAYPPGASKDERRFPQPSGASAMLIDATRKWPYMPPGLPKKEYMERAIEIWQEAELAPLKLKKPWHGYHLGRWTEENEEAAKLTVAAEHVKLGEIRLKQMRKLS
jgi:4-hydroxy-3-polyprenylbenzoate decarboxylase